MATHYVDIAGRSKVNGAGAKKLLLICLAESANKGDRRSYPGMETMLEWTGVKRARLFGLIQELCDDGLIARHKQGRIGQQAEYLVFPHGCCAEHGPLPGYGPKPSDHPVVESNPLDPPPEVEGPGEGPAEDPLQVGPQPSFRASTSGFSGGVPHVSSARELVPPSSLPVASPPAAPGGPPMRSCARWPAPHGACGACAADREALAAWEAAAHREALDRAWAAAEAERARQAQARADAAAELASCRLCDARGVLPSGERCRHDPTTNPGEGRAAFRAALARLPEPPAPRAARRAAVERQGG